MERGGGREGGRRKSRRTLSQFLDILVVLVDEEGFSEDGESVTGDLMDRVDRARRRRSSHCCVRKSGGWERERGRGEREEGGRGGEVSPPKSARIYADAVSGSRGCTSRLRG
jgi:hypothetical protein